MTDDVYPSIGIFPRLRLKLEAQLFSGESIEKMTISEMVRSTGKLPMFALIELWENFHQGTNLDDTREEWLKRMLGKHGFNHMEYEALVLYRIVKGLVLTNKR